MEVIDRYIYAVTQRLPEQQREDIKRELQSLIEDMLEERIPAGQASKEDVESVLLELGHPNELAAKYRGYERYLIGPMLLDTYLTTLKIVLASIVIGLSVVFVPFIFEGVNPVSIPDAKMKINRSGPILGIFFTIVIMAICFYLTDLLGIWRYHDGVLTAVPC